MNRSSKSSRAKQAPRFTGRLVTEVRGENERSPVGVSFSVPYEIAAVRPLRQTSLHERESALKAAGYNCDLLPQEMIYIDLCTDSGVSAPSTAQIAGASGIQAAEPAMGMASEASRAFASLSEQYRKSFGFPYLVPTTQGRAAERIWAKIHVKPGSVVPGNMLFPSTRMHIESNGGKVIDVIGDGAHNFQSEDPFKGDFDLDKLAAVFREHGSEKVSCIYAELSVNACGGHPVSLANLKQVKAIAAANNVPLFVDACRILENSYLIRQREAGYHDRSIHEIALETCESVDGCTMSAMKDLLVPMGGMIGTRDPAIIGKRTCRFSRWRAAAAERHANDQHSARRDLCRGALCEQPSRAGYLSVAPA